MKRSGFTLIELIVVVIVIGILATLAVPQYLKATERAKSAKARHALGVIAQAEKLFRADAATGLYSTCATIAACAAEAELGGFVELNDIVADADWTYTIAPTNTAGAPTFLLTAERVGNAGSTITLTEQGIWGGARCASLGGTTAGC